jgi:hypothetical protein
LIIGKSLILSESKIDVKLQKEIEDLICRMGVTGPSEANPNV